MTWQIVVLILGLVGEVVVGVVGSAWAATRR